MATWPDAPQHACKLGYKITCKTTACGQVSDGNVPWAPAPKGSCFFKMRWVGRHKGAGSAAAGPVWWPGGLFNCAAVGGKVAGVAWAPQLAARRTRAATRESG